MGDASAGPVEGAVVKSCPFCGGLALQSSVDDMGDEDHGAHYVRCTRCYSCSAPYFGAGARGAALARWNTRAH